MKQREITANGQINTAGQLTMFMGELNEFFKKWRGARVFARFVIVERKSSEALKGYYFHCVVPTFKAAIWESGERLTEEQTEKRLRAISPIMHEQTPDIYTGSYHDRVRAINEVSNAELIEHIEFLKQYAAENYNIYIEDPNEL